MTFHPPVYPPQIKNHPGDQIDVPAGSTVEFIVTATGDGNLKYKWQHNGANLDPPPDGVSGETTNTLTIASVQERHQGVYSCVVSNAPSSSTTSHTAQLTVCKCILCLYIYLYCALRTLVHVYGLMWKDVWSVCL